MRIHGGFFSKCRAQLNKIINNERSNDCLKFHLLFFLIQKNKKKTFPHLSGLSSSFSTLYTPTKTQKKSFNSNASFYFLQQQHRKQKLFASYKKRIKKEGKRRKKESFTFRVFKRVQRPKILSELSKWMRSDGKKREKGIFKLFLRKLFWCSYHGPMEHFVCMTCWLMAA